MMPEQEKPHEQGKSHEGPQDNHQSGEQIISGANNEDQLDKIKQNVPEGGRESHPKRNEGTPPDAYKYEREEGSGDTTQKAAD